ncbi:MAG: DUF58 domain-containing protein [Elusimicrobiota bacterium]|nr:DUF58 domain-containing protein [Elusimicrobiota bacterium]
MDNIRCFALRTAHTLRHWLRSRWTSPGRLALGALAAAAVLGMDTHSSMAYQAFTFLLAAVLISLVAARGFRPRLEAVRALPRFGTAGEPIPYRVRVRNLGAAVLRDISLAERLPDPAPTYKEFRLADAPAGRLHWLDRLAGWSRWRRFVERRPAGGSEGAVLPDLPPGGSAEVSLQLLPPRRGVIRLEAVSASRPDPLGLATAERLVATRASVIVLPRRYPVSRLSLPGGRKYQQGGVALASSVGESMEFSTLRDYKPGDPPRRIHWKSFARTGRLIVKENHDEYFVRHALVLDTFTGPGASEAVFEEAVSVTASFACTVLTQESLLDLLFVGAEAYHFTAGRGLGGAGRMLEILAAVQPCNDKPFEELSRSVAMRYRLVSGCILVLVAWDDARRALTRQLRALGVPLQTFLVRDPASGSALPGSGEGVRVLETGRIAEGLANI